MGWPKILFNFRLLFNMYNVKKKNILKVNNSK